MKIELHSMGAFGLNARIRGASKAMDAVVVHTTPRSRDVRAASSEMPQDRAEPALAARSTTLGAALHSGRGSKGLWPDRAAFRSPIPLPFAEFRAPTSKVRETKPGGGSRKRWKSADFADYADRKASGSVGTKACLRSTTTLPFTLSPLLPFSVSRSKSSLPFAHPVLNSPA